MTTYHELENTPPPCDGKRAGTVNPTIKDIVAAYLLIAEVLGKGSEVSTMLDELKSTVDEAKEVLAMYGVKP